jgi:putative ABC transport system permease protein
MTRLALFIIMRASPRRAREWIVGDTIEELARIRTSIGDAAARRWLWREVWRVLADAPRHRIVEARAAARHVDAPLRNTGDGPVRDFFHDLRYTLRLLRRAPAFTAIAIATLALGIGANTAIFAVVNAVILKPLPFAQADRLMLIHLTRQDPDNPGTFLEGVWSYPKYRTFEDAQQSFDEIAMFAGRDIDLSGDGDPQRVRGEVITDRYLSVLGVVPIAGRAFSHDEANLSGLPPVMMIGHALWMRRFGGDAAVVGRTVRVNATPYTVVGVLPPGFRGLGGNGDVWVPLAAFEPSQLDQAQSHSYTIIGRRKADISEAAAGAAVRVLGRTVDAAHGGSGAGTRGAVAHSLYSSRIDTDIRRAALVLLGAVGFVLLIACVNLTNLVAAKAMARRREVAVRVAIGASRGRIVRQFLTEGFLLTGLGAMGGLIVAVVFLAGAAALLPDPDIFFRSAVAPGRPRIAGASGLTRIGASMIGLDWMTALFTGGVALLSAMLVSLLPAGQASMLRPSEVLKTGARGSADGGGWLDTRALLVTTQIALALILLAGAGLMIRSTQRLQRTAIGINPEGLLTARVDLPRAAYDNTRGQAFFAQLIDRVRALPGVESAALGLCPPVSGGCNDTLMWFPPAPGPRQDGSDPVVGIHWVTPDYFATMGVALLKGRSFAARDREGQPNVILVNETAARTLWPNQDPVGKRVAVGQGGFHVGCEVVGVVSDVRYRAIETAPMPDVYVPLAQSYQSRLRLFIRTRLDPAALAPAVSGVVRDLDPNIPMSEVKTMSERVGDAMWRTRVSAWVLGSFAALALLLTAIGIFGVMAQAVAQRTAEIGIRMALGAGARDVLVLVLGRAAGLTAAGVAIGTAGAAVLTRFLRTLLYGIDPGDPLTFVSVALLIAVIALVAGYIPARRATRVDAMEALRAE